VSDPINHLGLLVIDLQDIFLNAMTERDRIVQRAGFAIEAAALLGAKIAVTEQMPEKLGPTSELISAKLPAGSAVFGKSAFSALEAEGLREWLQQNQIEHLLILGIETPICVYQTAVQALSEDLGITLLSDCIGERRSEDRAPIIQQLLSMDAHVLPAETIFYSLLGTAAHPQFKAYTQLVKAYSS